VALTYAVPVDSIWVELSSSISAKEVAMMNAMSKSTSLEERL
jgi:hypothetical protein